MYKLLLHFIILFIIAGTSAISQDKQIRYADQPYDSRPAYGVYGHLGYNVHNASPLPGLETCCPLQDFDPGNGIGYAFGLFYSFPLSEKLELSFRAGLINLSGKSTAEENIVLSDANGNPVDGIIEHSLEGTLSSFGLTPLVGFRLTDQMTIRGGFRIGFMAEKKYEQMEEITEPGFGVFRDAETNENLERIRNHTSGDIPDDADPASIEAALLVGLSYDLPLNTANTLFLSPEAFLSMGVTPVATDWMINTFSGGIAIKYAPREVIPPKVIVPPLPPPDPEFPPPPAESPILASIIAKSVDENGREQDVSTIHVRETLKRKVHPLLNYIFFDENSAEIPSKFKLKKGMSESERNSYSVNSLYGLENIDVYYNILNVVGRRMIAYPIANLTLNGYNSNQSVEKGNRELSRQRAQKIKDYLVNEWGIPADRIKVSGNNLPPLPSNNTNPDGQAENRRVEMIADYDKIFESLTVSDTIVETNPPMLRFKPSVKADVGIKSWKIYTAQESSGILKVFEGEGDVPNMLEWDINKEKQYVPKFDEPFLYRLEVTDNDNKKWESAMQSVPVQAITTVNKFMLMIDGTLKNDTEYDQYTLISFGFDKATLTKDHLPIVAGAKERLAMESGTENYQFDVKVTGHTDNMGDEQRNLDLSRRRALSTARALGVDESVAVGVGEAEPLYDNSTPEGRFYNRNVQIMIQTTIELK